MGRKTYNIEEVAKRAGVSRSTVSRAFQGRLINEATRKKVMEVAAELGYRPNRSAASLAAGQTYKVALLMPLFGNPHFAELVLEFERAARKTPYHVAMYSVDDDPDIALEHLELIVSERRVDGVIIAPMLNERLEKRIGELVSMGVPIVSLARINSSYRIPSIVSDFERGGYLATRHLLELGHKRIAYLAGPDFSKGGRIERLTGYRLALSEYGIRIDEDMVEFCDYDHDSAYKACRQLLAKEDPPTAIFTINDLLAMSAYSALMDEGLSIPKDVSLVGYDNVKAYAFARLTTVCNDPCELASRALALLMSIIDPELPQQERSQIIEPRLVVRQTTGVAKMVEV